MPSDELVALRTKAEQRNRPNRICVCTAASCQSIGADRVHKAFEAEVKSSECEQQVEVRAVGCMGLCSAGPLVRIENDETSVLYRNVTEDDATALTQSIGRAPVERLICPTNVPFFTRQHKIVLINCGRIHPERIEDYVAVGGYEALYRAITEMTPTEVLAEVKASGLRGRGGAGYPTGLKWQTVAKSPDPVKYVVCNADEGDPGAFMDRSVLESDPHRVLEGMAIAAYAVGASLGYVYVRAEYPLAISRLRLAIRQAKAANLLGQNVAGTRFEFSVDIRLGAGAFVCGEETALLASIEGRRGQPRPRPPYPAERGLLGRPTLINNVETYANIAPIVERGGASYASIGTERSKGTKVFALAGQVKNTGLIEVPMGISLREIVEDMGGGVPGGGRIKAVQTGGPSGGCIPYEHLEMPVDYDSLQQVGSIMGSGGMIVMDESSDMVEVARYFMEFSMSESCGKCVPCRVGTYQMHQILSRMLSGCAGPGDLAMLEELTRTVGETSLCGLGQSAPKSDKEYAPLLPVGIRGSFAKVASEHAAFRGRCNVTTSGRVVTLRIDDREVSAREDETILQVARDNEIFIPTLCCLEGLSAWGACRLCLVEVAGSTKLLAACVTRVAQDLEVRTDTPRILAHRRTILELLFSERNHVCSVCVANGKCELQNVAQRCGVDHIRMSYRYPELRLDLSNDLFRLDPNRCILCTRCVRVCDEIEGAHTWDVMGRGIDCQVITDLKAPWGESTSCTSCGKCVHVCPTGALSQRGTAIAEVHHHRDFLPYLTLMRGERD